MSYGGQMWGEEPWGALPSQEEFSPGPGPDNQTYNFGAFTDRREIWPEWDPSKVRPRLAPN